MLQTKEQLTAQQAFTCVDKRKKTSDKFSDYESFAESFPTLIHTCGLVQALAFAQSKKRTDYIEDLTEVFNKIDSAKDLLKESREAKLEEYMRITRRATMAATWIKRYCQAFAKK